MEGNYDAICIRSATKTSSSHIGGELPPGSRRAPRSLPVTYFLSQARGGHRLISFNLAATSRSAFYDASSASSVTQLRAIAIRNLLRAAGSGLMNGPSPSLDAQPRRRSGGLSWAPEGVGAACRGLVMHTIQSLFMGRKKIRTTRASGLIHPIAELQTHLVIKLLPEVAHSQTDH